ncbi:cysteine hydrolase family protein [Microbacterium sp. NPDC056569]|uniref:cysteine hydrolase family protein n=1 Tax=Microbacterium sp. NPDC056569 TaxID=3345867 RepID=UPI00366E24C6
MKTFDTWMNGTDGEPVDVAAKDVALIVIDMQRGFIEEEYSLGIAPTQEPFAMAVPGCVALVESAREAGVPVIFTRATNLYDHADALPRRGRALAKPETARRMGEHSKDVEIIDELTPLPTEYVVDKSRPGAIYGTRLEPLLVGLGIRSVVICGVTTNICVETTAREAHARGYDTYVVADATGEAEPSRYWHALYSIEFLFGTVAMVEDVQRSWGTEATGVPGFPLQRPGVGSAALTAVV